MEKYDRLLQVIEYLKDNGLARKHEEIAERMHASRPNVSNALNGVKKYLTDNFLRRFASAYSDYINEEWLLTGNGEMIKPDYKRTRPFVDVPIRAGYPGGLAAAADIDTARRMPLIPYLADYDITLPVEGESMSPILEDGDIMAVRRLDRNDTANIKSDKFYVIDTERDGAVVKRLTPTPEGLLCESVNPKYKPFVIPFADVRSLWVLIGSVRPEY